ncbi:hypothetical protein QDT40_17880, partial [Acinetobacter baumannii]|uniref:hypothetical protein n=1 Tax=Acinetobacter baumannii TaxID=470 RepID=UPI00244D10BE
ALAKAIAMTVMDDKSKPRPVKRLIQLPKVLQIRTLLPSGTMTMPDVCWHLLTQRDLVTEIFTIPTVI